MARIISYNKLWKLLIDKVWTKSDLGKHANISPASITKLGKGKKHHDGCFTQNLRYT